MKRQRRRDTTPELALRSALHALGLRFRVDYHLPDLGCRPDIAFTRAGVAVFVDGCFWHGCPEHGTQPRANAAWWRNKLAANRTRDERMDQRLAASGWESIRVWEHQDAHAAAEGIQLVVLRRLGRDGPGGEPNA